MSDETINDAKPILPEFPGNIPVALPDVGHYPGCKAEVWEDAKALNAFFGKDGAGFQGLLLRLEIAPCGVHGGKLVGLWTRTLKPEEQYAFNKFHNAISKKVEEELRAERQAEVDALAKAEEEEKETKRLAEVGRKYEARTKAAREMPKKEREAVMKEINSGKLEGAE